MRILNTLVLVALVSGCSVTTNSNGGLTCIDGVVHIKPDYTIIVGNDGNPMRCRKAR